MMWASKDRFPYCHLRGQGSGIYLEHKRKLGRSSSDEVLPHDPFQWSFCDWLPSLKSQIILKGCAYGEKSPHDQFQFPQSQQGPCLGMWSMMQSEVLNVQDTGCLSARALSHWSRCDWLTGANKNEEERWKDVELTGVLGKSHTSVEFLLPRGTWGGWQKLRGFDSGG